MPKYRITIPAYVRQMEIHLVTADTEEDAIADAQVRDPDELEADSDYYEVDKPGIQVEKVSTPTEDLAETHNEEEGAMQMCQRCSTPTASTIMSMFNTELICDKCKEQERTRADYPQAEALDIREYADRLDEMGMTAHAENCRKLAARLDGTEDLESEYEQASGNTVKNGNILDGAGRFVCEYSTGLARGYLAACSEDEG